MYDEIQQPIVLKLYKLVFYRFVTRAEINMCSSVTSFAESEVLMVYIHVF